MKKVLSFVLVAVMLLSTLMLTSCDPAASINDFLNKIVGTSQPIVESKTTITEAEWDKAWETTNYELTVSADGASIVIASTGEIVKVEYDMIEYAYNAIVDVKEGVLIYESSVGYLGMKSEDISSEDIAFGGIGFFEKFEFSELTYDETKKAYVYEDEFTSYEFHFEDGKLVYAKMAPTDPEEEGLAELKNIGTTVIDIPEYTIINDGKVEPSTADTSVRTTVTSEELAAHLDLRNFTINAVLINEMLGEISLKAAENGVELSVTAMYENMKQYIAIVDGNLYSVEKYGDGHLATSLGMTMEQVEEYIDEIQPQLTLDYLTYDEEGRYYKIEQDGEIFYLFFENGQLVKAVYVRAETYSSETEYMEVIFIVSDIGTTEVEIPEYTMNK